MLTAKLVDLKTFVIEDTLEPPPPGIGEAQIRVEKIGICGSDISAYYGRHPYIHCPIILGHEFAGVVDQVGPNVTNISVGDRCTILPHLACGECRACKEQSYNHCGELKVIGAQADGAFTRYINVPAEMVFLIPDSISMEEAALVEPAAVGYHSARRGNPQPNETALVFGAGPIGMFTMQAAKAIGGGKVLIADMDAERLALAEKLGADGTINTSVESVESGLARLVGSAENVDLFFDCVGFSGQVLDQIIQIARQGVRVIVTGVLESGCVIPHLADFVEHELSLISSNMYVPGDFRDVIDFMAAGKIRMEGMVTHTAPLSKVEDIYKMIDTRSEKFFKIVLTLD